MASEKPRREPTQYVIDNDETSILVWISSGHKMGSRGRVVLTRHGLLGDETDLVLCQMSADDGRRSEECLIACLRDMLDLAEKRLALFPESQSDSNS